MEDPDAYKEYYKPYSADAWFVQRATGKAIQVESAIAQGKTWEVAVAAMELGSLLRELDLGAKWGPAALFGDEQMGKLKSGGESRIKYQPELVAAFVKNLLDPKNAEGARNKVEAVSMAADHFKISISTVYDKLKKVKESTPDASDRSK